MSDSDNILSTDLVDMQSKYNELRTSFIEDVVVMLEDEKLPKGWKALAFFRLHIMENKTLRESSEELGISIKSLSVWKKQEWFKVIRGEWQKMVYGQLHDGMLQKVPDALDGYVDVMRNRDVKTANARVSGMKLMMEMGKDPLIQKGGNINIQQNTVNQSIEIDMDKFKELSQEEMIEVARTGVVPDSIKKVN